MKNATISMLVLRPLVTALAPSPTALAELFHACDLTAEQIADTNARITTTQLRLAWENAIRLTGQSSLPLQLAAAIPPGSFGVVEYLCRTAPTLGAALRQWIRYCRMLNETVELALILDDDRAHVRVVTDSDDPSSAQHELCFSLIVAQSRSISSHPLRPIGIEFVHHAPFDQEPYRRHFDAPVIFGAKYNQITLPVEALVSPLVTADASFTAMIEHYLQGVRVRDSNTPPLTAKVRRILGTALRNDDGGVDAIAHVLGLTSRSLQRRLKDEGSSFQDLRDEIRRELADRYLEDDLSISEISFLLGFSEPSAFFRAFKRWTGVTPIERRTQRRSGAPSSPFPEPSPELADAARQTTSHCELTCHRV